MAKQKPVTTKIKIIKALRKRSVFIPLYAVIAGAILYLLVLPFFPQVQSTGQAFIAENPKLSSVVPKSLRPLDYSLPATGNWLIIPKANIKMPIVEGATLDVLNSNVGVWHQTGPADDNFVLAGHRLQYGRTVNQSLYNLDKLEQGDVAVFVVLDGKAVEYKVTERKIVPPTSVEILNPSSKKQMTIYTCQDFFNQRRFVIVAEPLP